MKRVFLIIFLFLLNIINNSQSIDGYGVKVGLGLTNHSWQYDSSIDGKLDWENNSGIAVKAFADIVLLSFLQVESEIGYIQKGAKYKIAVTTIYQPDGNGEYININNRLNYFSISLMAKLKYNSDLFSPYLLLGPEYNYLLNKQIDKGFEVVYDKFKKNAFGFTVGFGSEVKLLPINIIVEYRYSRDFTNNYESYLIEIKNYSHTFLIGVRI
ncbi:MAG: outer membrane beta-barrel protein [Ignavibacteria bacterium]|nr:outer membrane beta-barrel protein [Ignavibacteria bacterium]MDP3831280.1 outer membrane beta-barrel protein [Ignavibacteriaceae bacterium]